MATKAARTQAKGGGYRCSECGWTTIKWVGRCGECQAWGTVEEVGGRPRCAPPRRPVVDRPAIPIGDVDARRAEARRTGVGELDRVLGGGLVPGAVVLLAGEPGIGKSTLLLDVAARAAREGRTRALRHRRGVRRPGAAARRADRGAGPDALPRRRDRPGHRARPHRRRSAPTCWSSTRCRPSRAAEVDGAAGDVTQVREVAAALIARGQGARHRDVLVGHVTKDGSIAGPRVLEHLVDVVLQFEGDRHSRLRLVRAVKNRYGPTDEVGCFDLADAGIVGLPDPSGLFLSSRRPRRSRAPASPSPSRAAARWSPRCRRWWRPACIALARGARPAGWTVAGSR